MALAYFPSLDDADVIEVAFLTADGGELNLRMFVDSGFTGSSSFVLPDDLINLAVLPALPAQTFGAMQGEKPRSVVSFRIPAIFYQGNALAILSDVTQLAFPAGVHGIAGLQFLRQFDRWGAEETEAGDWQFFLQTA